MHRPRKSTDLSFCVRRRRGLKFIENLCSLRILSGVARLWPRRFARAGMITASGLFCLCVFLPSSTETAIANGDTRTLYLYHAHTGESIDATYRVDGHYDPAALKKLNWFLRDWRRNEETNMDPRLFDAVWESYRGAGANDRIIVLCGYRSPQTNAMLRRRSRRVAQHSQHMLGKAMDTTMPGVSMEKIRETAMRLQMGGVGYYPSANFVHIDVGGVRAWPRMSYDQLVRLFPDGKTVHIAADGRTLPGYEEARAEIEADGGSAELRPPPIAEISLPGCLAGRAAAKTSTKTQRRRSRLATLTSPMQAPIRWMRIRAPPTRIQPPTKRTLRRYLRYRCRRDVRLTSPRSPLGRPRSGKSRC